MSLILDTTRRPHHRFGAKCPGVSTTTTTFLRSPTSKRDHPYHGGPPHGMVTPTSPTIVKTPQGIQQLHAELQQAKALINNGCTLFATQLPDLSGAVVAVDGDDFADCVAGDSSLHSPIGSTAAPVKKDVNLSRAGNTRN